MIKIGDLLYCKKEFESLFFKTGYFYTVMWMNSEYLFLSGPGFINKYPIHRNIIPEFFYTKSEIRKTKLEKLKLIV